MSFSKLNVNCNDEIINEESNRTDNYCDSDNSGALDLNSTVKTDSSNTNLKTKMGNNLDCSKSDVRCNFKSRASYEKKLRCIDKPEASYRNPFFNYLRDFRKSCPNLTAAHSAMRGARRWNCLSVDEKEPYLEEACNASKMVYRKNKKQCNEFSNSTIDCGCEKRKRSKHKCKKAKLKCPSKQRRKHRNVKCERQVH